MKTKSNFFQEFKKFISRGNVMDLAVGLIIGTAFTAIVKSLVNDIIMPIVGLAVGGVNFSDLKIVMRPAVGDVAELAFTYGTFLQAIIDFLLIAFVVFILVRTVNSFTEKLKHLKKEEESVVVEEPSVAPEIALLTEIRDLLKK